MSGQETEANLLLERVSQIEERQVMLVDSMVKIVNILCKITEKDDSK